MYVSEPGVHETTIPRISGDVTFWSATLILTAPVAFVISAAVSPSER